VTRVCGSERSEPDSAEALARVKPSLRNRVV
jgi:hypothetical protein